jgi:hypothetical protein
VSNEAVTAEEMQRALGTLGRVLYAPRAKELQALAVQIDLTEAIEKLTKLIEEKIG